LFSIFLFFFFFFFPCSSFRLPIFPSSSLVCRARFCYPVRSFAQSPVVLCCPSSRLAALLYPALRCSLLCLLLFSVLRTLVSCCMRSVPFLSFAHRTPAVRQCICLGSLFHHPPQTKLLKFEQCWRLLECDEKGGLL
jgi:hypothetical protein